MASLTAVATGDWNTTTTWNPAQTPVAGDTVNLDTFTVTIPADITAACLDLQIPASGTLILAVGSILEIDDAASATINVAAGGAIQTSGTTATGCGIISAGGSAPTNPIQFTCDGTVDLENTTFSGFEIAGFDGTMTLIDSDLSLEMTGTTQIAINLTGSLVMTRSSLRGRDTAKTWYWNFVGSARITMDKGSDFGTAMLPRLQGTSTSLTFLDAPLSVEDVQPPRVVIHGDLIGASTARARKVGMGPRIVTVGLAIQEANLDDWAVLNDMKDSLTETTFRFVWDEGYLHEAVILELPRIRRPEDVGEIFSNLVLVEVTTS